jgi:hypothetical protein
MEKVGMLRHAPPFFGMRILEKPDHDQFSKTDSVLAPVFGVKCHRRFRRLHRIGCHLRMIAE